MTELIALFEQNKEAIKRSKSYIEWLESRLENEKQVLLALEERSEKLEKQIDD
ncbi:MAG: hypothetical protein ACTSPI_16590 [Candidatus Heimdallarchaeaceae archaeon]